MTAKVIAYVSSELHLNEVFLACEEVRADVSQQYSLRSKLLSLGLPHDCKPVGLKLGAILDGVLLQQDVT